MPRLFLAEIHRRVVIEAGPLDGATEVALRADPRPGAKAILDAVARRRGRIAPRVSVYATCCAMKASFGPVGCCMLPALMKPA